MLLALGLKDKQEFGLARVSALSQEEAGCQHETDKELAYESVVALLGWTHREDVDPVPPWQRQDKHSSDQPQCPEPQGPKINVLFNNMREVSSRLG